MTSAELGQTGEELAAKYLMEHGFRIMHRNWNLHHGCELDIVAFKDNEYHFVEVKTRSTMSDRFGAPEQAINLQKLYHVGRAALHYMAYFHIDARTNYHLDSIGIVYRSEDDYDLNMTHDIQMFQFSRRPYKGRSGGRFR